MNIAKKAEEGKCILALQGRLDTITAPELEKSILEELDGADEMVLDMAELDYISSAGLRVLLMTQKAMNEKGSLELWNVCEDIMDVLDITGFIDILTIRNDR